MQNRTHKLISGLESNGWPPQQAAELAAGAHIVPYERRSIIFHAGETADLVYVLLSGEVKLLYHGVTPILVRIARGGDMLGVFAPDSGPSGLDRPEQIFTAEGLTRSQVAILPTARLAQVLHQLAPAQMVRVLEQSREQWTALTRRTLGYLTMSVRVRLLHALAELAEGFGVAGAHGRHVGIRLSHEDLAALVGASRAMVSKHMNELTREGLLSKQQGRLVVRVPLSAAASAAAPIETAAGHLRRAAGAGQQLGAVGEQGLATGAIEGQSPTRFG